MSFDKNQQNVYQKHWDKTEIILEVGVSFTRVGFNIDTYPRRVFQTKQYLFPQLYKHINSKRGESNSKSITINNLIKDEKVFEQKLQEFLYIVFFQELLYSPKDRHIYLIYNYYQQDQIVNKLAYVLYKNYEVNKITFLLGNVLPLQYKYNSTIIRYISDNFSGMVIDGGFLQTTFSPVYEGQSLLHYGGRGGPGQMEIMQRLLERIQVDNKQLLTLQSNYLNIIYERDWQEKVIVQIGQMVPLLASQRIKQKDEIFMKNAEKSMIKVNLFQNLYLSLSYYSVSWIFADTLYGEWEEEQENLAYNFLLLIRRLNKEELAQKITKNIIFAGGMCLYNNYVSRFKDEVKFLIEREFQDLRGICQNMCFTQTANHPTNLNWVGGSIISQTNLDQFTLTAKQFSDNSNIMTKRSDGFNFIPVSLDSKK